MPLPTLLAWARMRGPLAVAGRSGERTQHPDLRICGNNTRSQPDGKDAVVDVVEPITPIGLPTALLGGASPIGSRTVTSARVIVIEAAELTPGDDA